MVILPSQIPKPMVIKSRVELTSNRKYKHQFQCFCGNKFVAIGADVTSGRTQSCGCFASFLKRLNTKHGLNKTPEHRAWVEMKRRCYDSTRPGYDNYGGRGIIVCDRWLKSFSNFLADMGQKPDNSYSLDRIDNDKGYEPSNCRWAARKTQSRNQRRHQGKKWLS